MPNKIVTAGFTCILLATHVSAQENNAAPIERVEKDYNAETMMKFCKGEVTDATPEMQSFICTFRIQGTVEMMNMNCLVRDKGYTTPDEFSSSPPASRGALKQAFLNYMEDHPEVWEYNWSTALALSISETFPCNK